MKACKVDENQLGEWIDKASGSIRYIAPAITEKLAHQICAAQKRTGERNYVLIDLNGDMDRSGYGKTAGVRKLHENGIDTKKSHGLRIAALTTPEISAVWSPIAERVDSMRKVKANGILFVGEEQCKLKKLVCRIMGGDQQPEQSSANDTDHEEVTTSEDTDLKLIGAPEEPNLDPISVFENDIKKEEKSVSEHPPRNFKDEKKLEVYQGYIGFVEIHVIGASLSEAATLAIPKQLIEIGLAGAADDLRQYLSERMRIDLDENANLGVSAVTRRVESFKLIFTKKMGRPLGRIYKKSDWKIMQEKWRDIDREVEVANQKIHQNLGREVKKKIRDTAEKWEQALKNNLNTPSQHQFNADEIESMLNENWINKKRPTEVKIEMFPKDLTWETLNDQNVRNKIEDAYPELRETGLYKSSKAYSANE